MCIVGGPNTNWLRSLQRTLRLVTIRARPASASGLVLQRRRLTWDTGEAKPPPRASRFALAAASFGVALLAADHLYNGANQFINCIIYLPVCIRAVSDYIIIKVSKFTPSHLGDWCPIS